MGVGFYPEVCSAKLVSFLCFPVIRLHNCDYILLKLALLRELMHLHVQKFGFKWRGLLLKKTIYKGEVFLVSFYQWEGSTFGEREGKGCNWVAYNCPYMWNMFLANINSIFIFSDFLFIVLMYSCSELGDMSSLMF